MMQQSSRRLVTALMGLVVAAACSHATSTSSSAATQAPAMTQASMAPAATSGTNTTPAAGGAHIYQTNCSSCHQLNGQGTPGAFPPLASNPAVTGDPAKVIHIVKYGLTGAVSVDGKTYNGMMPAWGTQLSDADLASAITYVRTAWGNQGSAVSTAQVSAVSK
jgi:mono/diheme cytochrome c family protein